MYEPTARKPASTITTSRVGAPLRLATFLLTVLGGLPTTLTACGDDDGGGDAAFPTPCTGDDDCGPEQTCVRSACLADCGADPTTFDAAVTAPGVAFLANVCRTAAAFSPDDAVTGEVWELTIEGTTEASIARFSIDAGNGSPDPVPVASTTLSPDPELSFFPNGFVAPSPGGDLVAIGYTQEFGDPGELILVPTSGDGRGTVIAAPGNFDVSWLDDDRILVNGLGLETVEEAGQGLYAVDLAGDTRRAVLPGGGASGSVGVTDEGLVLYGNLDESFASVLRVLDPDAVADAIASGEPLGADAPETVVRQLSGGESAFVVLPGEGRIVATSFDEAFNTLLSVRTIAGSSTDSAVLGDAAPLSGPVDDATVFSGAVPAGGSRVLLRHASGLLLVDLGDLAEP